MDVMKSYNLSARERTALLACLDETLATREEILFAYIHGSFVENKPFHDIDIGVYLRTAPESPLEYELKLETACMDAIRAYPIDVRVLNSAPLWFRYNVIRNGTLLFTRDEDGRADFQESVLAEYFDFAPHRENYLRETIGVEAQSR